ncbi:type IV-A pilus assembly ATPase PilB, partial [Pseudomonas aeruginosa]
MNDSTPLSGLAKQLVLNELLDEKTARQAQVQAARNKQSLVSHLVQAKLVQSRALVEVNVINLSCSPAQGKPPEAA